MLKPLKSAKTKIESCNDVHFLCTFFQGTDDTMGDSFAPLGPLLLHWENLMGRGKQTTRKRTTSRLLDRIGPVGQFGEKRTNDAQTSLDKLELKVTNILIHMKSAVRSEHKFSFRAS